MTVARTQTCLWFHRTASQWGFCGRYFFFFLRVLSTDLTVCCLHVLFSNYIGNETLTPGVSEVQSESKYANV